MYDRLMDSPGEKYCNSNHMCPSTGNKLLSQILDFEAAGDIHKVINYLPMLPNGKIIHLFASGCLDNRQ